MSYVDIFMLALALSIDAFVVSFSYGLCIERRKRLNSFLLALTTGSFQAFMPVISYFFTGIIKTYIEPYSKITVFIIFAYLGINFIIEGLNKNKDNKKIDICVQSLLLIGIATSIDALSSGITLSLTNTSITISSITIGAVTFINSIIGYWLGYYLKNIKSRYFEIIGGIILLILASRYFPI